MANFPNFIGVLDIGQVIDFQKFSSKTGLRKINSAFQQLRNCIAEIQKLRQTRSPRVLYVQTDSVVEAIIIDAIQIEILDDGQISSADVDFTQPRL